MGTISFYENGSVHSHILNDTIGKLGIAFFTDINVDSSDNLLLSKFYGGFVRISHENVIDNTSPNKRTNIKKTQLLNNENKTIGWFTNMQEDTGAPPFSISYDMDTLTITLESPPTNNKLAYCSNGDLLVFSFGTNLFVMENGKIIDHKKHNKYYLAKMLGWK